MTGSTNPNTSSTRKALIFGLEGALASSLTEELSHCNCSTTNVDSETDRPRADIVFCPPARELLKVALSRFRGLPIVVVSRLPEVEGWLDALEDGAADYCAAPFEPIQLRWLLDTHIGARHAYAAA